MRDHPWRDWRGRGLSFKEGRGKRWENEDLPARSIATTICHWDSSEFWDLRMDRSVCPSESRRCSKHLRPRAKRKPIHKFIYPHVSQRVSSLPVEWASTTQRKPSTLSFSEESSRLALGRQACRTHPGRSKRLARRSPLHAFVWCRNLDSLGLLAKRLALNLSPS